MAYAIRMAHRVGDRGGTALRQAQEREALQPGRIDYGLQILDPRVEREAIDFPVRETTASLVVAHHGSSPRQPLEPVPPDRAAPVELQMGQPVRSLDQGRSAGPGGVDGIRPLPGCAEPDLLLHGGDRTPPRQGGPGPT